MFTIGLTGGIGSGKTVVSDRFAALGAGVIDSDVLARSVTAPGGAAIAPIAAAFGHAFITPDGALDRARMRECVFNDPQARGRLEAITHPLIRAESARALAAMQLRALPYLIYAVPLLVESGQHLPRTDPAPVGRTRRFDRILLVDCSVNTQIQRVMSRSGLDDAQARAIIAAQATREQRRAAADDILFNENLSLTALHMQIDALHRQYLAYASAAANASE
jgi:dephospho-CoA kinase